METRKGRRWGATIFGGREERRRGGSMVSEANDTMKSGAAIGEAEGSGWEKYMSKSIRYARKIREGIMAGQNGKEKSK
jgi:hypothetical protein